MTAAAGSSTTSTRGSRGRVRSKADSNAGSRNVPTAAERRQELERAAATKQFFDMFQTLLVTLQEKYIPRAEYTIEKQQQDRMMIELTGNVREVSTKFSELMEMLPERFPQRREFDSANAASLVDRQELRKLISEVVRDRDQDERRDWDYKLGEQGRRYEGDLGGQRDLRTSHEDRTQRNIDRWIQAAVGIGGILLGFVLARGGL